MTKKGNSNDIKERAKIILLGLDNSGKTSIVYSLQKRKGLHNYSNISPTKNHNIEEINTNEKEYIIWDIGGQTRNREDFLSEFEIKVEGTNKIIYVIDVQDIERYDKALQYLSEVIENLKKCSLNVKISVFLHKFDPHLTINRQKLQELIREIEDLIPNQFEYSISKTSIFTVFRKKDLL
ncbi:MAG: ADP-ribosylation factor-like protein [Promethearchaeia archaeon]